MLMYEGNGLYSTEIQGETILISSDDIYNLIRDLEKHEGQKDFVSNFNYNECYAKVRAKTITDIHTMVENIVEAEEDYTSIRNAEIEEETDTIITEAQNVANEYYRENYILIEKYT